MRFRILKINVVAWSTAIVISLLFTPAIAQPSPKTIRVVSSADTISTMTEIPGGDHLIPESQVFVGGKNGTGRWLALLGIAIDKARNQSMISGTAEPLRMKFDSIILQSLAALSINNIVFDVRPNFPDGAYDAKLLPSARFLVEHEPLAHLSFRLTARIRDASTKAEITKNYLYGFLRLRPFVGDGGWAENNSQLLREASKIAFEGLVDAFAQDIAGQFAEALLQNKQRTIKISSIDGGPSTSAFFLGQSPKTIIVMPMFRDQPLRAIVQVIDKESVRIEGLEN